MQRNWGAAQRHCGAALLQRGDCDRWRERPVIGRRDGARQDDVGALRDEKWIARYQRPGDVAPAGDIVTAALATSVPAGELSGICGNTTARLTAAAAVPSTGVAAATQLVPAGERTENFPAFVFK